MKKGQKPESSRLNFFYIYHVLHKYTDEETPLSVSEIAERINFEFAEHSVTDKIISVDTVKRTLEGIILEFFPDGYYNDLAKHRFGFEIVCVVKTDGKYMAYDERMHSKLKKYYYMEHDLSKAEIRTLMDAVETYGYFSKDEVTDMINKLIRIRPSSFFRKKFHDKAAHLRDEDSLLLMNIDDLNEIIRRRNKACITYCKYSTNKKLVPRDGYPKTVEPLSLMWSNGYYYLLAYNPKYDNITNFRVDRITDIEEIEERVEHPFKRFNPVEYRNEHPIMYSGSKERFKLLCRDNGTFINTIIDVFGRDVHIEEADESEVKKHLPQEESDADKWILVSFSAAAGGVELWATQYCRDCIIVKPQESANRVKDILSVGLSHYSSK